MGSIFQNWGQCESLLFNHQPMMAQHTLHQHSLFQRAALADLIDQFKRKGANYTLVRMGEQGSPKKEWKVGKIGDMSGAEVINEIERSRLWINLLHVNNVSPQHGALLAEIYREIGERVPDLPPTYKHISGILISSPRAQVYYHFDTTGQNLWQIAGSKTIWVYPPSLPFLRLEELEEVTLRHNEVGIHFEPWYDAHAVVFDLQPGSMIQLPLNAPHRVENGDALSVSLTTEFFTKDIHRHMRVAQGNAILRSWGRQPSATLSRPAIYAKTAIVLGYKAAHIVGKKAAAVEPAFRL